ncbi:aminoacyl-tRNA hydrolase [Candidatus Fukatsuia symbiotica]|uniref:Peptidyl-tRNA hydrolase n=1 Tax=Candidatus Fukatsuia symbiotica TaxID=1878942 RepID=A0A2U8I5E9_9GAMM|nr:aminoacyl-tRNA hydrolase [Candidatus Fukatsuia symbiotica]AWK14393.1 aminoacyl-tRNA hydrolase [Candidatus Fukatsuia symbiotica]MEA9444662.1 aminoacyl-tRNA hydrolase [Candidatus Fukatsuia symbiotica]
MTQIKLIVGLANPGIEYAQTRHNAGAWFLQCLVEQSHQSLQEERKFYGHTARINLANHEVRLLVPTTFMNLSGKAVAAMANFYRISPEEILVAHDELDFLPGVARFKFGGGNGGHNGLKDIQSKLTGNTANFHRLRIGIGHPGDRNKVLGFVLGKPPISEKERIDEAIGAAIHCIELCFKESMDRAIQHLHSFKVNG